MRSKEEQIKSYVCIYIYQVLIPYQRLPTPYMQGEKLFGYTTGIKPKEGHENRPKKAQGGNMRERKLKAEIKEMRQDVARAGNEFHRQKQQKKSTKKENRIMKELGTKINGKEVTSKNLRIVKEQWLEKLCYKKVKLEKYIEKRNRKKHNIIFQAFSGL